ncbi:GAF domain-containing protein [Candidatus Desulfovibrio trichonymphae]|uniref:GAF domain-containing protein n=1 Tax=Candidatus Desulfovibrio trichonymphae TaxID=1725232 RepID=A0A1J1DPL5_9BACT|nr:GAF domain-containing protein [Candidatus Desulfovibrio trichonymphae]BAV91778.1 GAF domain-containing protein [Candidatus Desulfovibrio trichonymphae]GHV00071.1 GAF domain-containing protein [Deltaproteobacteria bacterium]
MTANSLEKHILGILCSVFDAYSAVLFQPDDHGEAHHLAAFFSLGDKIAPAASILPGKGLVGWIIRNRQPLLVPNFDQRQSNLGYYTDGEEVGIKAFMGCQVPAGGALCVDSKRQYSFSDKDHKILQLFAELVSCQKSSGSRQDTAADIPRYFAELGIIQDLRFRYKHWPQFLRNYLRTMTEATGFEYSAFASVDVPGETYRVECESAPLLLSGGKQLVLPMGSGIAGWVFRNEQPVVAEGAHGAPTSMLFGKLPETVPDFQAVICMPMMVNKSTRGVLCLAHTGELPVDEAMRSFVRQSVDHLALFLENLYLKNRLRSILPKAKVHSEGSHVYDPDNAPEPRHEES